MFFNSDLKSRYCSTANSRRLSSSSVHLVIYDSFGDTWLSFSSLLWRQISFNEWNICIRITSRYHWVTMMDRRSTVFLLICCLFLLTNGTRPPECELDYEVGVCRALIPMFYFNRTTNRCEKFSYGGCDGSWSIHSLVVLSSRVLFLRSRKWKPISSRSRMLRAVFH